jgi:hypothetical protein
MIQTSAFCLAQEVLQRERAADADLENVRIVATLAAAAWAEQAVLALRHEAKLDRDDALPAAGSVSEAIEDRLYDESSDRGSAA